MASNADVLRQVGELLMRHSSVRARRGEPIGLSRRPNAPRLITIAVAIGLTLVGLAVTVHPIQPVLDLLDKAGIEPTREQGWWALVLSPALLVVGSLFRGI